MIAFLMECILKINPKCTTQSLPTHSHNTRLWHFWIFWALSHSKNFKSVCYLESFIFRFVLNLLKCALFIHTTCIPQLFRVSNNNIVRSPIKIVARKSNPFSFNVICLWEWKRSFPCYQIIERLLCQGIV